MRSIVKWLPVALIATACSQKPAEPPQAAATPTQARAMDPAKRGEYLVNSVAGCDDCHSPKVMTANGPEIEPGRRLSGHRASDKKLPIPANVINPGKWGALSTDDFTGWVGPWGVSYTRNLTPDVATGLGSWTEAMFIKTIREGKHQGEGRPLLPPMPWPTYRNMTDEDLKAIWAFLKTLPPVNNAVPEPVPPEGMKK